MAKKWISDLASNINEKRAPIQSDMSKYFSSFLQTFADWETVQSCFQRLGNCTELFPEICLSDEASEAVMRRLPERQGEIRARKY